MESLIVLGSSSTIELQDLPVEYQSPGRETGRGAPSSSAATYHPRVEEASGSEGPIRTLEELEREAILMTLEKVGGNRTRAAELLGIGLRTLQRKLKDYGARPGVA
jgi:DNA-binding NtrC family response regulator